MTATLDMKKTLKHLYKPRTGAVNVIHVPPMRYLMIDGQGNPNTSQEYVQAIEVLYPLAYGIRAISKAAGMTFTVMPLEGLWSFAGQEENTSFTITEADKDTFQWTMMIVQPDHVTAAMVEEARQTVRQKHAPAFLDTVRFETYDEGNAVQIMHIGPYADEGQNIRLLHEHIEENGWMIDKKHHEIYLSDPRKTAPEKLKTIIRQPFLKG